MAEKETGDVGTVAAQDTQQIAKMSSENQKLAGQINKLKQDSGNKTKTINSLKVQLQVREKVYFSDSINSYSIILARIVCLSRAPKRTNLSVYLSLFNCKSREEVYGHCLKLSFLNGM